MDAVAEIELPGGEPLPREIYESAEPILLRGYVSHWPAVQAARRSAEHLADYLTQFDAQLPLTVYVGPGEIKGRFFYNEDCTGFNFRSGKATLAQVLGRLLGPSTQQDIETIYIGSTPIDQWLPGFRKTNDVQLPVDDALVSLWVGSPTTVSAHFDFPDNLACVVAGTRRFTLFPIEQIDNLYIGPIDKTPSGQAISLVDFDNPDFERFPRFAEALKHAVVADMQPGDALYLPSMWWHHVAAAEPFNMLVNYWWRNTPAAMGAPLAALNHGIMALRDLPERQRRAWKRLFDYYVFEADEHVYEHIPPAGRGVLEKLDEQSIRRMRAELLERLKQ